jgi:drug/metabolite transporter (DMT)-like permease
MLRGLLVAIVGIYSVIFLKSKLFFHHWFGIVSIVLGTILVGLASILFSQNEVASKNPILGDSMILISILISGFKKIQKKIKKLKN